MSTLLVSEFRMHLVSEFRMCLVYELECAWFRCKLVNFPEAKIKTKANGHGLGTWILLEHLPPFQEREPSVKPKTTV